MLFSFTVTLLCVMQLGQQQALRQQPQQVCVLK
jgi:hypothetical protein